MLGVDWAEACRDGGPDTRSVSLRLLLKVLNPGSLDQVRKILPHRRVQALDGCRRSRRRGRASLSWTRVCCPHTWARGPPASGPPSPLPCLPRAHLPADLAASQTLERGLPYSAGGPASEVPQGLFQQVSPPQSHEPMYSLLCCICAILLVLFLWSTLIPAD